MNEPITPERVAELKRQAWAVKKESGCLHSHALQQIARNNGFRTWEALVIAAKQNGGGG